MARGRLKPNWQAHFVCPDCLGCSGWHGPDPRDEVYVCDDCETWWPGCNFDPEDSLRKLDAAEAADKKARYREVACVPMPEIVIAEPWDNLSTCVSCNSSFAEDEHFGLSFFHENLLFSLCRRCGEQRDLRLAQYVALLNAAIGLRKGDCLAIARNNAMAESLAQSGAQRIYGDAGGGGLFKLALGADDDAADMSVYCGRCPDCNKVGDLTWRDPVVPVFCCDDCKTVWGMNVGTIFGGWRSMSEADFARERERLAGYRWCGVGDEVSSKASAEAITPY
ncbi:MAG: hypothetical protein J5J06_02915 [Phycisphaerae bacterium]|nr:hypothetical protein [Phycisphaerae bacterium]